MICIKELHLVIIMQTYKKIYGILVINFLDFKMVEERLLLIYH